MTDNSDLNHWVKPKAPAYIEWRCPTEGCGKSIHAMDWWYPACPRCGAAMKKVTQDQEGES